MAFVDAASAHSCGGSHGIGSLGLTVFPFLIPKTGTVEGEFNELSCVPQPKDTKVLGNTERITLRIPYP